METSGKKHLFNTILFGILSLLTLINAVEEISKLVINYGGEVAENVIQISPNLLMIIIASIIILVFPLIFSIIFVFHILAFKRCDLNAKQFNTEYKINLVLLIGAIISLIFVWYISNSPSPEGGMILIFPGAIGAILFIVSIVTFFNGYFKNKINN